MVEGDCVKKRVGMPLGLFAFLLTPIIVLATAYSADITVVESNGVNYPNLPIVVSVPNQDMADESYMTASGRDTRVSIGATEYPHMVAEDRLSFCAPIGPHSQTIFDYTTNETPVSSFYIIPGWGGNLTALDAAAIQVTDNYEIAQKVWLDTEMTSTNFTNKGFLGIGVTNSGNVTHFIGSSPISPTGHTGGSGWAGDETNAYDDNNGTTATDPVPGGWTDWLELTVAATTCDSIRFMTVRDADHLTVQIEVYYSGAYHAVYNAATYSNLTWELVSIGSTQSVTKARYRQYINVNPGTGYLYEFDFGGSSVTPSYSGLSRGWHTIAACANVTHTWVSVNGTPGVALPLAGIYVPDTNDSWVFCEGGVMCTESISITVDGVLQLYYLPNTMIVEDTVPDLQGGDNDGTITWGYNPTGTSFEVAALLPLEQSVAEGVEVEARGIAPPTTGVGAMHPTGPEGTTFPLYGLFKSLLTEWAALGGPNISMPYFWKIVAVIIAWIFGSIVTFMTRNVFIGFVAYLIAFIIPAGAMEGVLDLWVPIVYAIGGLCIALLTTKWTSSSA